MKEGEAWHDASGRSSNGRLGDAGGDRDREHDGVLRGHEGEHGLGASRGADTSELTSSSSSMGRAEGDAVRPGRPERRPESTRTREDGGPGQAPLASWPTVAARDGKGAFSTGTGDDLPRAAAASWATPTTAETAETADYTNRQAMLASWTTPQVSDGNGTRESDGKRGVGLNTEAAQCADSGEMPSGSSAETRMAPSGGRLDPGHSCWLQAFPAEWGSFADTATRSTSRSPSPSSRRRARPSQETDE